MTRGKLIVLSLIALLDQGAAAQSAGLNKALRDDQSRRVYDAEFKDLFGRMSSDSDGRERPEKEVVTLPSCYRLRDMTAPPAEQNWAQYHVGKGASGRIAVYVETTSIAHCHKSDEINVIYWQKVLFQDNSYFLHKFNYNCTRRKGGYSDVSWYYSKDGNVDESPLQFGIDNPLPTSSAYKLMRFICDGGRDNTLTQVPEIQLIWRNIKFNNEGVPWYILSDDIEIENNFGKKVVKFWVKKDYSRARWTKFRYTYSYDSIKCDDQEYSAGQAYAFLPNAEIGKEVYESSMRSIAPKSIQASVMDEVCVLR